MIGSTADVAGCVWPVDAGRRGLKGDSARGTDRFRTWRSGAAGRRQTVAWVVGPIIF
jgi:hypothetical protein